jgi:hypothetical protein
MNTLSPNLQSLLDNRLRYLPPITGAAIGSVDWSAKVIEIGHKYGLHIDEMEDFQAVVLKSMIGLIAPANFEQELITALALSPSSADKVIEDVNIKIFGPIHDYVMRQGKPVDGIKAAGIVLQDPSNEPAPQMAAPFAAHNTAAAAASVDLGNPVDIDFGANTVSAESVANPTIGQLPVSRRNVFRELAEARARKSS